MRNKICSLLLTLSMVFMSVSSIQAAAIPAEEETIAADSSVLYDPPREDLDEADSAGEDETADEADSAEEDDAADEADSAKKDEAADEADSAVEDETADILEDEADSAEKDEAADILEDAVEDDAADIDVASLSPQEYASWKANLVRENDADFSLASEAGDLPGAAGHTLTNNYLGAYIQPNGQFTLSTTGGDPQNPNDDSKLLLYQNDLSAATSQTLVRVDGKDYWFHRNITDIELASDSKSCVVTARLKFSLDEPTTENDTQIEVKQTLTLETNAYTGLEDTFSIRYEAVNLSSAAKEIGFRLMLDTMLDDNDAAPFRVRGQAVTTQREFNGAQVPEYWQAFDNLTNPSVISTGFLYKTIDERPDKVQFIDWNNVQDKPWDVTLDNTQALQDSSVAIYFDPLIVSSGSSRNAGTYYGVSSFTKEGDVDGKLAVAIFAPTTLDKNDQGTGYVPDPFGVMVYVANIGGSDASDVEVLLDLAGTPQILQTDPGRSNSASTPWALLSDGESVNDAYSIWAYPQSTDKTVPYQITVSADYAGVPITPKIFDLTLELPKLASADQSVKTVIFDKNDGSGEIHATETVASGAFVPTPAEPVRTGYTFKGWYSNAKCTGLSWYNEANSLQGYPVTANITLYAGWKTGDTKTFEKPNDWFSFTNSYGTFPNTYSLTADFLTYLLQGEAASTQQAIRSYISSSWGGSCFGMSAVASLTKAGILTPGFFQTNATRLYDLKKPAESQNICNLINFYQLVCLTPQTNSKLGMLAGQTLAKANETVVKAVQDSAYPVVICMNTTSRSNGSVVAGGGHAVVGYGIKQDAGNYLIDIWDPNDMNNSLVLTISGDYQNATFDRVYSGNTMWWTYAVYKVEDAPNDFNYKNIEQYLRGIGWSPNAAEGVADNSRSSLITSYTDFSIALLNSAGQTLKQAEVSNVNDYGVPTLDIQFIRFQNELSDADLRSLYSVPALGTGEYYVIEPSASANSLAGTFLTALENDDNSTGFLASVDAADAGKIIIRSSGEVKTAFNSEAQQTIQTTLNSAETAWNTVTVKGADTGFTVSPSSDETIIASANSVNVEVTAGDVFNEISFDNVTAIASGVAVAPEAEGSRVVSVTGPGISITPQTLGYAVIFHSQAGSPVENEEDYFNVAAGSTIRQPSDPVRPSYIFGGWFKDQNYTSQWNFSTDTVASDTNLYAKWTFDLDYYHVVTFRSEGANDQIVVVGDGESITAEDTPFAPALLPPGGAVGAIPFAGYWNRSLDSIIGEMIVTANHDNQYGNVTSHEGTPTMLDVVKILRNVAGYNVDFSLGEWAAAHVRGVDGDLDMLDVVRLLRHVAGYNVTLGPDQ
ncbi:MAG: InlB B-repeat-containing protein [Clostridiales bacterium]|nr:InlB B-repeat-containing protein [Clostridiales bacterium]